MAKEKVLDPEDSYRKKLDMCITDAIIKGGGGILLGTVASVLIIKRRWPITTGLGIGMGFSFANCHFEIRQTKRKHPLGDTYYSIYYVVQTDNYIDQ